MVEIADDSEPGISDYSIETLSEDSYTWFGKVDDMPFSDVILSVEEGILAGEIRLEEEVYHIRHVQDDYYVVAQIDPQVFPEDFHEASMDEPLVYESGESFSTRVGKAVYPDVEIIDVMVVFTTNAMAETTAIGNQIRLAIDQANRSFRNDGLLVRLRLIASGPVSYNETDSAVEAYKDLIESNDGYLDELHDWRDQFGADLVCLWLSKTITDYGGYACIMESNSSSQDYCAYSVVKRSAAIDNMTFIHEIGHNLGARHDWAKDSNTTPYEYAHGYVRETGLWRTIMAYDPDIEGVTCNRILYWSNPRLTYNGEKMGVHEGNSYPADNCKVLYNTSPTVANYR